MTTKSLQIEEEAPALEPVLSTVEMHALLRVPRGRSRLAYRDRALLALHGVRRRLGDAIARVLPEPQAALAQGFLLGERASIPQSLTDEMNATGTSHLVAVSGQNQPLR